MLGNNLFDEWLKSVSVRGGRLLGRSADDQNSRSWEDILKLCHALLSSQAETTGVALAEDILDSWLRLDEPDRRKLMHALLVDFGPDVSMLDDAIADYKNGSTPEKLHHLHDVSEPRRQELIRNTRKPRLNHELKRWKKSLSKTASALSSFMKCRSWRRISTKAKVPLGAKFNLRISSCRRGSLTSWRWWSFSGVEPFL